MPDTYTLAAQGMRAPDYMESRAKRDLLIPQANANPLIVAFAREFIRQGHLLGIPLRCHCIWRSNDEQARLKAEGRSKAGPGQSPHNHGLACDIIHATKAWSLTKEQWQLLHVIGQEIARRQKINLTWGGGWSFYDPAHWELKDWRNTL